MEEKIMEIKCKVKKEFIDKKWAACESIQECKNDFIIKEKRESKESLIVRCVDKISDKKIRNLKKTLKSTEDFLQWGILTTGEKYLLYSNVPEPIECETWKRDLPILEIDINRTIDRQYFKYLSWKEVKNRHIEYFCDINNYRNSSFSGNQKSWNTYNSSLKRFANYCIQSVADVTEENENRYSEIDIGHFVEFVNQEKMKSPSSIRNAYAHIKSFIKYADPENEQFEKSYKEILLRFEDAEYKKISNILEEKRICEILTYMYTKKKSVRNLCVFFLSFCYGMERNTICNLKWENIYLKDSYSFIELHEVKMPIPDFLEMLLIKLKYENEKKGFPGEFIFYTTYRKKVTKVNETVINGVFNDIENVNMDDHVYQQYAAANIRRELPIFLLKKGIPLEEILYLLEMDIRNQYFTKHDIIKLVEKRYMEEKKKHPMEEIIKKLAGKAGIILEI